MGTRGSALALWQARWVVDRLRSHHPDIPFQTVEIHTEGDRKSEVPLHRAGDTGLFVKELEYALLNNEVELAVHSLKDMPSRMPPQLAIAAVPEREDPRDSLISQRNLSLAQLPAGACVGTGSPRRKAQLLALRPDLNVVSIRGNVDTRLRKLRGGDYEAIILAAAGLIRLQQDGQVTEFLCPVVMLPA
ncbi:MAG: hydroxymethylbilane synthase, partial [Anaerolineae bacterium]